MDNVKDGAPAPSTPDVIEISTPSTPEPESASLIGRGESALEMEVIVPQPPPLSWRTKINFGIGEIGGYVIHLLIGFYLQMFLLDIAKVPEILTGHIFLIGQIWSALANPFIGYLSDRTRTQWGRRRPWILFAALPLGICQSLIWQTPDLETDRAKFFYYCLMFISLNTCLASTSVPYTSLTPEIAPRYDDSTALTSLRFVFGLISGLISLVAFMLIVDASKPRQQDGYSLAAIIFAVVGAAPSIYLVLTVPEKSSLLKNPEPPKSWRKTGRDLIALVQNRAFVTVCLIYLLCWVTTNTIQSNLFIYLKYVLHVEKHNIYILIVIQLAVAGAILFWQWMCARYSKKTTFCIGAVYWSCVHFALFFLTSNNPLWIYILSAMAGVGVGLAFLLPWSMLPDVIEEDELRVGERREGFLYSVFVVLQQMGIAGALAASSYALGLCGYVKPNENGEGPANQPEAVQLMLRLLVGPISSFVLLIALVMGLLYPITRERRARVSALLAERHARASAVTPNARAE